MADQTTETAFKQAIAAELQDMATDRERDQRHVAGLYALAEAQRKAKPWYERVWLTIRSWLEGGAAGD